MFALFKKQNPYVQPADLMFRSIVEHIKKPFFYSKLGVPDTYEGRFDLLVLHVFAVMDVLIKNQIVMQKKDVEMFNQALFDKTFKDLREGLRQQGIGDTGIPKHMKRMMLAFNGRVHSYREAINDSSDHNDAFKAVLVRNLYGGVDVEDKIASDMVVYIQNFIDSLASNRISALLDGHIDFDELKEQAA